MLCRACFIAGYSWILKVFVVNVRKYEESLPTARAFTGTTLAPLDIKAFLYDETWCGHNHARGIERLAS